MIGAMLDHSKFYSKTKIPVATLESINNYVEQRWRPGSFLAAVLENDLRQAYWTADDGNLIAIPAIVYHLYNNVRSDCWGSPERVRAWLNSGAQKDGIEDELRPSAKDPETGKCRYCKKDHAFYFGIDSDYWC